MNKDDKIILFIFIVTLIIMFVMLRRVNNAYRNLLDSRYVTETVNINNH